MGLTNHLPALKIYYARNSAVFKVCSRLNSSWLASDRGTSVQRTLCIFYSIYPLVRRRTGVCATDMPATNRSRSGSLVYDIEKKKLYILKFLSTPLRSQVGEATTRISDSDQKGNNPCRIVFVASFSYSNQVSSGRVSLSQR
jgi:hypothetical protein